MTTSNLVQAFCERIWTAGDPGAASELLASGLSFRGSLGAELHGRGAFLDYVRSVRSALSDYRCEIVEYARTRLMSFCTNAIEAASSEVMIPIQATVSAAAGAARKIVSDRATR